MPTLSGVARVLCARGHNALLAPAGRGVCRLVARGGCCRLLAQGRGGGLLSASGPGGGGCTGKGRSLILYERVYNCLPVSAHAFVSSL